jgi:hypothetical protein
MSLTRWRVETAQREGRAHAGCDRGTWESWANARRGLERVTSARVTGEAGSRFLQILSGITESDR